MSSVFPAKFVFHLWAKSLVVCLWFACFAANWIRALMDSWPRDYWQVVETISVCMWIVFALSQFSKYPSERTANTYLFLQSTVLSFSFLNAINFFVSRKYVFACISYTSRRNIGNCIFVFMPWHPRIPESSEKEDFVCHTKHSITK